MPHLLRAGVAREWQPTVRDTQGLRMEHEPASMLPESFPAPKVVERWAQRGVAAWTRGYGEWGLSSPPEESRLAAGPGLERGTTRARLDRLQRDRWASYLEEGEEYTITWPPEGNLWDAGYAHRGRVRAVPRTRSYADDPDCEECRSLGRAPDTIEAAVWDWYVTAETWAPVGRQGSMSLEDSDRIEMRRRTRMDPREVEYNESEGPFDDGGARQKRAWGHLLFLGGRADAAATRPLGTSLPGTPVASTESVT